MYSIKTVRSVIGTTGWLKRPFLVCNSTSIRTASDLAMLNKLRSKKRINRNPLPTTVDPQKGQPETGNKGVPPHTQSKIAGENKVIRNGVRKVEDKSQKKPHSKSQGNLRSRKISKEEEKALKEISTEFETHRTEASKSASKKKRSPNKPRTAVERPKIPLTLPSFLTVSNLSTILRVRNEDLLTKLKELGFENMTYNYILDSETAALIADEYGFEATTNDNTSVDLFEQPECTEQKLLVPRAPVVTIMGHVDHGKTTILDYLRKSSIVNGEFGGITQHIGAFSVKTPKTKKMITFLDTPGHAAFLKMRQRGADVTDIVVLVVAADDSVMPQTKEAIKHAKNSGVPIIVAINKCDKPDANPDKVVADLAGHDIDVEDYGGETQVVRVSGKTGLGMEDLEESIITLSEVLDLKAQESNTLCEGWVIESEMKKGLGNTATFLVRRGVLERGKIIVAGNTWCKVKIMKDEHGKVLKKAGPSTPVEVIGWKDLPEAGQLGLEAKDEALAKKVILNRMSREEKFKEAQDIEKINEMRQRELREANKRQKIEELAKNGLSLEDIRKLDSEEYKDLLDETKQECEIVPFIIRADVSGSSEAIAESIDGLGNDEVKSKVLYQEVGPPTETDIERAETSGAIIFAFNLKTPKDIIIKAERRGVHIKSHNVIYHLIEEVTHELQSRLKPDIKVEVLASAKVRAVFSITGKSKKEFKIAGCKVSQGIIKRNSQIQVTRNGQMIYRGHIDALKHERDDVAEVKKGMDCGVSLGRWQNFEEGDDIEVYEEKEVPRYL
ncbi:hypothetical protein LJB42_003555 [Komagataella kurtzmanii]|nr:hypothetical protein LJB42_003555 [Komagataella kurtzmanii]